MAVIRVASLLVPLCLCIMYTFRLEYYYTETAVRGTSSSQQRGTHRHTQTTAAHMLFSGYNTFNSLMIPDPFFGRIASITFFCLL